MNLYDLFEATVIPFPKKLPPKLDQAMIIAQKAVSAEDDQTRYTLHQQLRKLGFRLRHDPDGSYLVNDRYFFKSLIQPQENPLRHESK